MRSIVSKILDPIELQISKEFEIIREACSSGISQF